MKIKVSCLGVFYLACLTGGAGAQAPSLLEYKSEHRELPPLWISADAVSSEKKTVDLDLIGSESLRTYVEAERRLLGDRVLAMPDGKGKPPIVGIPLSECERTILPSTHRGGDDPRKNLADLRTYSRLIVRGTIRTVQPGFVSGIPSSLLGIDVQDVLKGDTPATTLYIDYPVASFKIGFLRFCNGNKGFEPRQGDEVLLFDYLGPRDRAGVLYSPDFDQVFFQRRQGILVVPPVLKNSEGLKTARSIDDVVGLIRSGVALDPRDGEQ